jgi:sulfate permease, SulP family
MATQKAVPALALSRRRSRLLGRILPALEWLPRYRRQDLVGDLTAGLIVATMLVPQGMAYALLAGLPPQAGLYASIVPLILYGFLASSRYVALGPTAISSLLVASGIAPLAAPGSDDYWDLALVLALLVGIIRIALGLVRAGFLVNFLSHPVLSGFTSAAALIIGFSQLRYLLGIGMPATASLHEMLLYAVRHGAESNPVTVCIGLASLALLIYFRIGLRGRLKRLGMPATLREPLARTAPLATVLLGSLLVWGLRLDERAGVAIVGPIPAGLPPLTLPPFDWGRWQALLPAALTIGLVGFMESISSAKTLAAKRRQRLDADQELLATGAANLGAAFTGGYPVSGSFSRSAVSFSTGARTGMANVVTAVLIALVGLFLTPLLYFLPLAVLAVIIITALVGLIDLPTLKLVWRYSRADTAALLITFFAVLEIGVEWGIAVGVVAALALYLWRTSRPHLAVVGRLGDSEHFRNVRRYKVRTYPHVLAIRVDSSLYFANANIFSDRVRAMVADRPEVEHVVLIGSSINFIDASALETLEGLVRELRDAGVTFHLADFKGRVLDRLERVGFAARLGKGRVFISAHEAMQALAENG